MSTLPLAARLLLLALAAVLPASPVAAQSWSLLYTLDHPTPGPDAEFALSLASAGDLDGDGTDDLAVASLGPLSVPDPTRVYLYSGADGAPIDSLLANALEFGAALAPLDDLDGDGVSDLLVNSPGERVDGLVRAGRVYIYSGATRDTLRTTVSPAPAEYRRFGTAVAGAGDVDGDGVPDYAVGEPRRLGGGWVYLFSGATGDTLRTLRSPNPEPNGQFGQAVASIGDTDGDGIPDLLVAAPFEDGNAAREGRAYLFSGATGALLHTTPNPTATWAGLTIVAPGDITGDGIPDAVIGAPEGADGSGEKGDPFFVGRVHVVSGASGVIVRSLDSPYVGATFGQALAVVVDEDGDGVAEFAVGEPYAGGNGQMPGGGEVHIFSGARVGAPRLTLLNPARSDPALQASRFGQALATLRSSDGGERLVVASTDQRADDPGGQTFGRGRVYVYSRFPVASSPSAPVAGLSVSVSPNPARSSASLSLHLAEAASVRVAVVDALGRTVRRLDAGALAPGTHRLTLDVDGLPPGVYVVRVAAGDASRTVRLTVAR